MPRLFPRLFSSLLLYVTISSQTSAMSEKIPFYESDFIQIPPFAESKSYVTMGARIDCNHNFNTNPGDTQNCFSISGLRLMLREEYQPKLHGELILNPFASLNRHYDKKFGASDEKPLIRDSELRLIESFRFEWKARPRLAVSLGLYDGATWFPDYSGLPYAASYHDSGWKQTALSITYFLSMLEGARVRFTGGNGEGEILRNSNPQQYFGFEFRGELIRGLEMNAGLSTSGNLHKSSFWSFSQNYFRTQCGITPPTGQGMGWAVRRMSAGMGSNGYLPFAEGLKIGLGWHKSLYTQIDKDKPDQPSQEQLEACEQIDPELLLIEDPDQNIANSMEHIVTGINGSYRILDRWFIGFDYENRMIRSEIPFFRTCDSYKDGQCQEPSSPESSLRQWAWSVGAGTTLTEGMDLVIAYNSTSYSDLYDRIYFSGRNQEPSRSRDLFSIRVSYNWKAP